MNAFNCLRNIEFSVLLERSKLYFSSFLGKLDFILLFFVSFIVVAIITLIILLGGATKRGKVRFEFDLLSSYFSMSVLLYLLCVLEYAINRKYFEVFWHTAVLPIVYFCSLTVLYATFYTFAKLGYVLLNEKPEKLDEAFFLSINKEKRQKVINKTYSLPCNNYCENEAEKKVVKLKTKKRFLEIERNDDLINFAFVAAELEKLKSKNLDGLSYNESKALIETGGGINAYKRQRLSKLFSYMVKQGAA